jgi:TolB-like protein
LTGAALVIRFEGRLEGELGMRKLAVIIVFFLLSSIFCYAQSTFTLDNAIKDTTQYFTGRIPKGSKLVVLNIRSDNSRLANYIIEELTIQIVNGNNFTVVDRRNLETIRKEMDFQLSGEVSDKTAQSIGKKLGAQSIILGYIEKMGNMYRLQIQSIEVETARIQGMKNYILESEPILNALLGLRSSVGANKNIVTLNGGIDYLGGYLIGKIPQNSRIAILNISSANIALSNYIIDNFTIYMINESSLIVVDRRNLEMLQQEMDFQMSGEVSDDTAQAVGRKLGVQNIVSGKIEPLGDMFRLQIQVIAVETAQIKGMQSVVIKRDSILSSVVGNNKTTRYAGEDWKYKLLHVGIRPGFSFHFYDTADTAFSGLAAKTGYSIDIAAILALQIHQNISLQTELVFSADSMKVTRNFSVYDEYENFLFDYDTTQTFSSQNMLIPILVKGTWRPSVFSLEGLAGMYFSVPIGEMKMHDSFSGTTETGNTKFLTGFIAGGSIGVKAGYGLLFLDARYMIDFANTGIETKTFTSEIYRRSMVSLGIGYSVGFFTLKGGTK